MTVSVISFAGHALNDGTIYEAVLEANWAGRETQQVQVQPPGSWPRHIRADQRPRVLSLLVLIRSGTYTTRQEELHEWFAPGSEDVLVIDEDGVRKEITAVVTGTTPYAESSAAFRAMLVAADPRWRGQAPISAASLLTASGQGFIVTNPGNSPVDDCVISLRSVTNKAAASGYLYAIESIIAWRAERPSGLYAVELTEGWDQATEVGAGRSQADGDDVRVLVDGIEVPRWFGENAATAANQSTTNVWANLSFSPRRTATLLNAITVASPTADGELVVSKGGTLGFPREGALLVDDEVILYTGRTESNADGNAAFTGVTRGARGTTVAAHSAAATCYWVEHRVQIVYGNTGASTPDPRADLKPMLDLTSSTLSNVRHEWLNFEDDTNTGRSMQWGRRLRSQDDQADKMLAPGGSPAANMTLEYQSGGAVSGKPAYNTWYRDLPTGSGSSGGNIASITRAVADTLGMWAYGIDDAGQEVVLEKYAGALASGSDNIAAPTNPVYRCEFWGFNQVVARRDTAWIASIALTTLVTDMAQQFLVGSQPTELVAAAVRVSDSVGGANVTLQLGGNSGSDVMSGTNLSSGTYVTTAAGEQLALVAMSGSFVLQPARLYWLGIKDDAATTSLLYHSGLRYTNGKARISAALVENQQLDFTLYGRPGPTADSFERFDENALADDSDQITIDGVTIHLSSSETPYVALKARQDTYRFVAATLYNETTGESVAVNTACRLGAELRLDIAAGVAVNLDDENATSFAAGVAYSDPAARFTLAPGDNVLRFVEAGLAGVNVSVEGRGAWE